MNFPAYASREREPSDKSMRKMNDTGDIKGERETLIFNPCKSGTYL